MPKKENEVFKLNGKKNVSIRIDDDTHYKVCYIAKRENRLATNLMRTLLLKCIAEFEETHGRIDEEE